MQQTVDVISHVEEGLECIFSGLLPCSWRSEDLSGGCQELKLERVKKFPLHLSPNSPNFQYRPPRTWAYADPS